MKLCLRFQNLTLMKGVREKMKQKISPIWTLALSFIVFLNASSSFGKEVSFTLVYSSNTMGEVEPSC